MKTTGNFGLKKTNKLNIFRLRTHFSILLTLFTIKMSRIIAIKSNEGNLHNVRENVINISNIINDMIEDDEDENVEIPIPFSDNIVECLIKFCEYYCNYPFYIQNNSLTNGDVVSENINDYVDDWYVEFIDINIKHIFEMLKMADFLHIDSLIELCCLKIATLIKNKTSDELTDIFSIQNDFTIEEKEEFLASHSWIYEQKY